MLSGVTFWATHHQLTVSPTMHFCIAQLYSTLQYCEWYYMAQPTLMVKYPDYFVLYILNIFSLHNNNAVAAFKALTFEVACSSFLPGHTNLNNHTRPLHCVFKTKIPHIIKKVLY